MRNIFIYTLRKNNCNKILQIIFAISKTYSELNNIEQKYSTDLVINPLYTDSRVQRKVTGMYRLKEFF